MMDREEIREEIRKLLGSYLFYEKLTGYDDNDMDELLRDLSALGVVIRVDRELPEIKISFGGEPLSTENMSYVCARKTQELMREAGYVATEPLVEEK